MTMLEVVFIPRIKERLAEMGRSGSWLAAQTDIDAASISRIMAGKMVRLETAFLISAALGQPIEKIWEIKEVEVDE